MYENKTSVVIHKEIIADISPVYDKTDGSFVFDVTEPVAKKFEEAYQSMDKVADLIDVNNLNGDELQKFVNQRTGQERRQATYSVGTLKITGKGFVSSGDLFQTETGVQFISTESKEIVETGFVKIRSVLPGSVGNIPANQIISMPISISGIDSVVNVDPTTDGYEEETDESLRARYIERIQTPATSGNTFHYRNWAKEVAGVGKVRVIPLWKGDNTVKVVIIDAEMFPASDLLIHEVQDYIDPNSSGLGDGQAPIGAFTTVVSAKSKPINVEFNVSLEAGYSVETVIQNVSEMIINYLKNLAFEKNFVSFAQLGGLILDSEGVQDYSNLTVNGDVINVFIDEEEVAVLGGVTIAE